MFRIREPLERFFRALQADPRGEREPVLLRQSADRPSGARGKFHLLQNGLRPGKPAQQKRQVSGRGQERSSLLPRGLRGLFLLDGGLHDGGEARDVLEETLEVHTGELLHDGV